MSIELTLHYSSNKEDAGEDSPIPLGFRDAVIKRANDEPFTFRGLYNCREVMVSSYYFLQYFTSGYTRLENLQIRVTSLELTENQINNIGIFFKKYFVPFLLTPPKIVRDGFHLRTSPSSPNLSMMTLIVRNFSDCFIDNIPTLEELSDTILESPAIPQESSRAFTAFYILNIKKIPTLDSRIMDYTGPADYVRHNTIYFMKGLIKYLQDKKLTNTLELYSLQEV